MLRIIFFIGLLCPFFSVAQEAASLPDTLQEVAVYAVPAQRYATGSKISRPDSLNRAIQPDRSLGELLMQNSSIYLREYGPGMLSSIALRGTAANHTAVLWNGLNINSPNLGQTDFSLLPLFALDDISIQFGSSSALYGSDALGGTINLQNTPQWNQPLQLKAEQHAGSFDRYFSGLAVQAANLSWSFTTKVYHQRSENDFSYINTQKKNRPEETNRNARFRQNGVVQEIARQLNAHSELQLNAWYQDTDREIQPVMGDLIAEDTQQDRNLKLSLQYRNQQDAGSFSAQLGYLHDFMRYNEGNKYQTYQHLAALRYERQMGRFSLQTGGKLNHVQASIAQYADGKASENRADLYSSVRYQAPKRLQLSLNLRQALVSDYLVPFTPSLGMEYALIRNRLQLKAQAGRNYRIPTLNDRFWQPGGRPDMRPEQAWHAESGLNFLSKSGRHSLELTVYSMWVEDWIIWLPGLATDAEGNPVSAWRPNNIQEVHSYGLETSGQSTFVLGEGKLTAQANLAYTRSENKLAKNEYDRTVDKQLPFIPEWKGNLQLSYRRPGWWLSSNLSYTGRRFTTGEENLQMSLSPFSLLNLQLGKPVSWNRQLFQLSVAINNLFNTAYQNYTNRAMPGRNYTLRLSYQFRKTK